MEGLYMQKNKSAQIVSLLMAFVLVAAVIPQFFVPSSALTVDDITARADYLYNITWTAKKDVSIWNGRTVFRAGESHRIPYGQPYSTGKYICWGISVDDFLAAANDANSIFYSKQSTGGGSSAYYSMDCSSFVSYCWHLSNRTTTSGWASLNATNLGSCTSENVGKIRQGDALNKAGSHVVLVSRVQNGTYEITEQTVPEMKRSYYTADQLVKKYSSYTIYRNKEVDDEPAKIYDNVPEGEYNIVNVGSGKYLNAFANAGQAKADTNVCASNGDGTREQKFKIVGAGDKKYYIRCLSNDSMFCVNANSGSVVNDGANVHLWEYNTVPSKLWYFKQVSGAYIIYNAMNPNLVLTAASYDHRANVCVKAYNGSDLQKWRLVGDTPHSHSYTSSVTQDSTCTAMGIRTYSCSCGSTYTEDIPMKLHTAEKINGTPATCTNSGLTVGTKCKVCGAVITAQSTVDPLGHDWATEFTVDKEPTASETGEKSRYCSRCGERKDITVIPSTGGGTIIGVPPAEKVLYGDMNGDGIVNSKDLTRLMKYLSGENVVVVAEALDVNGDGIVNSKDLTRLMKSLSGAEVSVF